MGGGGGGGRKYNMDHNNTYQPGATMLKRDTYGDYCQQFHTII